MQAVESVCPQVGVAPVCRALGVPRAALYRSRHVALRAGAPAPAPEATSPRRPGPPRSLSRPERQEVLDILNGERFADHAPLQIFYTLLDESRYYCSPRTMYRILNENRQVRERRDQLRHPAYAVPELLAEQPNEVWSWDITKLRGPAKWTCYHLYVILDIFSRYVVGWMVATHESDQLARQLIEDTCRKQSIAAHRLTVHADRGPSMRSKAVAELLADLQVAKSHSRPHTSNDNPYSESQFKTMKYRPEFPDRFGSLQDARSFCVTFFDWYNTQHRHSGIAWLSPDTMHHGQEKDAIAVRQQALDSAYAIHPERFVKGPPQPPQPPAAAWINPPSATADKPKVLPNYLKEVSQNH